MKALYHRTKDVGVYPLGDNRFLVAAELQDELHDVLVEVEIVYPSLEIVAARSEVRNGPFTQVCNLTHTNMEKLLGVKIHALRLHEVGMIKSTPQRILAQGGDWRFLNELKQELKA